MPMEKKLGMEIRMLSNLLDRRMNSIISANGADDVTPVHGMILGYINHRQAQGHEVYQKDIEAHFDVARSTVTSTLKLMEKKGYVLRGGVAHDARLKRILLTPRGQDSLTRIDSSIQQTEGLIRGAMAPDEYQELMRLLELVKSVL